MNKKRAPFAGMLFLLAVFGASCATAIVAPAYAAQKKDDNKQERSEGAKTLDPAVAKVLQDVFTQMQNEQWKEALAALNKLIADRGDRMKPFDKATTYELRGNVRYNLEDYRGALSDFQAALNTNSLPSSQANQLRYYIAQLYFQLQDYQSAIRGLKEWISQSQSAGEKVDCNAYYLLAAAYTQVNPPNYRASLEPAEQAVACQTEPKKSAYDLLNLVYDQVGQENKRAALLEKMINYWPAQREYWTQLSGLYSTQGKDREAFAVLEVAYRAGLLKTENEIKTLVQYYSFFDNPYRGAKLLEREMNAGVVKRNVDNLTLLSQLWSQAREHKRAIPVLQEASKLSDKGVLSYRLGQVLVADERYADAEKALRTALRKGGMSERDTGDCWLLLGTAVFSQAGPNDRPIRKRAREAFVQAQKYKNSRPEATQWVAYLDAISKTEEAQDKLECQQKSEQRRDQIQRLTTKAQVCRLQGGTTECDQILEQVKQLEAIQDKTNCDAPPPAGLPSSDEGDDAGAKSDAPAEAPANPK